MYIPISSVVLVCAACQPSWGHFLLGDPGFEEVHALAGALPFGGCLHGSKDRPQAGQPCRHGPKPHPLGDEDVSSLA